MQELINNSLFMIIVLASMRELYLMVAELASFDRTSLHTSVGCLFAWASVTVSSFVLGLFGQVSGYSLVVLTWALLAGSRRLCAKICDVPQDLSTTSRAWTGFVPIAAFGVALTATHGILDFPADWDTLAYHLPLIDHWLQSGNLWPTNCAFWYMPGNNELLGLYLAGCFDGDYWVQLHNLLPFALLAGSMVGMGDILGLKKRAVWLVIVCLIATQPVTRQLVSAENDLGVVALFMASVLFGWRYVDSVVAARVNTQVSRSRQPTVQPDVARRGSTADLITFAIAVGLLAGTKYYALMYCGLAVLFPVSRLLIRRRMTDAVKLAGASVIGFCLLGSFWYVRNQWIAGSPLYPKSLFGGPGLWAEMRPGFQQSCLLRCGRPEVLPLLAKAWLTQAGPIPLFAVFGSTVVSPVWFLVRVAKKNTGEAESESTILHAWLGLSAMTTAAYLIMPNVVEMNLGTMDLLRLQYHPVRFGLPLMCVGLLSSGMLLSAIADSSIGRVLECVAWILAALQVGWRACYAFHWPWIPSLFGEYYWWPAGREGGFPTFVLLFVATFAFLWILRHAWLSQNRLAMSVLLIWIVGGFAVASSQLSRSWHEGFGDRYNEMLSSLMYTEVEKFHRPDDRVVVCTYRYYPFIGSRRQRDVHRPLWLKQADAWNDYLDELNPDLVVLRPEPDPIENRYGPLKQWLVESPRRFQLLRQEPYLELIRMQKEP